MQIIKNHSKKLVKNSGSILKNHSFFLSLDVVIFRILYGKSVHKHKN
nr:MAG TPA: hypothetical protein [Caudoviricetes sp.]